MLLRPGALKSKSRLFFKYKIASWPSGLPLVRPEFLLNLWVLIDQIFPAGLLCEHPGRRARLPRATTGRHSCVRGRHVHKRGGRGQDPPAPSPRWPSQHRARGQRTWLTQAPHPICWLLQWPFERCNRNGQGLCLFQKRQSQFKLVELVSKAKEIQFHELRLYTDASDQDARIVLR